MHNVENIQSTIIIVLKLTLHGISGDCAWGDTHTKKPHFTLYCKKDKYIKQNVNGRSKHSAFKEKKTWTLRKDGNYIVFVWVCVSVCIWMWVCVCFSINTLQLYSFLGGFPLGLSTCFSRLGWAQPKMTSAGCMSLIGQGVAPLWLLRKT